MMKRYGAMVAGIFMLFGGIGFAQDTYEPQEKAVVLEEMVVTATKTNELRKDISNSVILKGAMDIQSSPAISIGEFLSNESGIDWRTYGNYGGASQTINIRGMATDETQVVINGLQINSPSLGLAEVGRLPLNNIEKIEVVKGAGSVLYGSGAMAGTVNVITKRPQRGRLNLTAAALYGTESTYKLSAEHGMFVFGDLGYYVTANRMETDGFRDNSDLDHTDMTMKMVLEKGDALDMSLYGAYIKRDYGVPGVAPGKGYGNHVVDGTTFYSSESASLLNRGGNEDIHAVFESNAQFSDWLEGTFHGKYLDLENENVIRYNAGSWTAPAGEGLKSFINNRMYEVEGYLTLQPIGGLKVLVGMNYEDLDWDTKSIDLDTSGNEKPGSVALNDASIHTRGIYAEAQYRPSDFLKLTAGIRNEEHSTFGSESIPRFGIVVNPTESTAIKFSHGKHFKAPTPNDLFWPEDDFARGNPNLSPQTGWHTDVSLEQGLLDNRMFFEISYFDWNVDGKISWAPNPDFPGPWGDKWTPTNLTKSNGSGVEFGMDIDLLSWMNTAFSYTYTDAEEELEYVKRSAPYVPENLFKLETKFKTRGGMTASAIVRYTGERNFYRSNSDSSPTDIFDAYTTVDLKVTQIFFTHWHVTLQATNLLDQAYDTFAEQFVDGGGNYVWSTFPGAERSLAFNISYEY